MPKDVKNVAESYKIKIFDEIIQIIKGNKPEEHLLIGYSCALRQVLAYNDEEKITLLSQHFEDYIRFCLENSQTFNSLNYLVLFTTVLQNKSKISNFEDDLTVKIWNAIKENLRMYESFEECTQLMVLIVAHVSNEEFPNVMKDLLDMSVSFYKIRVSLFIF